MDFADAAWLSGNAAAARTWLPKLPQSDETDKTRKYVHAVLNQADDNADADTDFTGAIDVLRDQPLFIQSRVALAFGTRLRRQRRPADSRPYLRTASEGFALICRSLGRPQPDLQTARSGPGCSYLTARSAHTSIASSRSSVSIPEPTFPQPSSASTSNQVAQAI
jgi:hypothetical protein